MIFKTIDDETTISGQRIVGALQARKIAQQQATAQLEIDIACLKEYQVACQNGTVSTEQFGSIMHKASASAVEYSAKIKAGTGTAQLYANAQRATNSALHEVSIGASIASKAVKLFSATLNMIAFTAILNGISWLVGKVDEWIVTAKEAEESANAFKESLSTFFSETQSNLKTISSLSDRFDELSKNVDDNGKKIGGTEEEYAEFLNICQQVGQIMPELITGYTNEGEAIITLQGKVDSLTDSYKEAIKAKAALFISNGDEEGNTIDSFFKDYNYFINGTKDNFWSISPSGQQSTEKFEKYYGYEKIQKWLSNVTNATLEDLSNLRRGTNEYEYIARVLKEANYDITNITTENYNAVHDVLNNKFTVLEKELSDRVLNIRSAFQDMLYADSDYWNIDDKNVISAINSLYSSIDAEFIKENQLFSPKALQTFESNFVSLFNNDATKQAMVDFYTPIADDESVQDYVSRIKSSLETVQEYCNENSVTIPINFDDSEQSINDLEAQYQRAVDFAKDKFEGYDPKVIIDSRYQVKIKESSLSGRIWRGNFVVTNYSDEEDTAESNLISVSINDNYRTYIEQKIKKALKKEDSDDTGLSGIFSYDYTQFCGELKKYCLDNLNSLLSMCQSCINILIEQGVADSSLWSSSDDDLYHKIYQPYYQKLQAIESEISLRQGEINTIAGSYDENGLSIYNGMQTYIVREKNNIQDHLDFQKYLGEDLLNEFSAYQREDKYSNSNYISDGLNNAQIFKQAREFIQIASEDLYKSAELQHSISAPLKNLFLIKKFQSLANYFIVGNWIRILIDDQIYKLRLWEYEIDFDNLENITVNFSDVMKVADGISDFKSIFEKAKSMASSYDSTKRQASQGAVVGNTVNGWVKDGLDVTNTKIVTTADSETQSWDSHGMLFRQYDPVTDSYNEEMMKIIHSTLVVTDDGFKTVKTAVGGFFYIHPKTQKLTYAYGINAETLIGRVVLGESLGIYTDNQSLTFDGDGLNITNGVNTFTVNPNSNTLLKLSNSKEDVLFVDSKGGLHIRGDGSALDISANETTTGLSSLIQSTASEIRAEVKAADNTLSSTITQTAKDIRAEVKDINDTLSSTITQTASEIRSELKDVNDNLTSTITQTASDIRSEVSKADEGLLSKITQNANGISAEVTRATTAEEALSASIKVNADNISLKVSKDSIISEINQTPEKITIKANRIDLEGLVNADELVSKFATITTLDATTANLNDVIATKATIGSLDAVSGRLETVETNYVSTKTLEANYATITSLNTVDAKFNNIDANNITAGTLSVNRIDTNGVSEAVISKIATKSLVVGGNISSQSESTGHFHCTGMSFGAYTLSIKSVYLAGEKVTINYLGY